MRSLEEVQRRSEAMRALYEVAKSRVASAEAAEAEARQEAWGAEAGGAVTAAAAGAVAEHYQMAMLRQGASIQGMHASVRDSLEAQLQSAERECATAAAAAAAAAAEEERSRFGLEASQGSARGAWAEAEGARQAKVAATRAELDAARRELEAARAETCMETGAAGESAAHGSARNRVQRAEDASRSAEVWMERLVEVERSAEQGMQVLRREHEAELNTAHDAQAQALMRLADSRATARAASAMLAARRRRVTRLPAATQLMLEALEFICGRCRHPNPPSRRALKWNSTLTRTPCYLAQPRQATRVQPCRRARAPGV